MKHKLLLIAAALMISLNVFGLGSQPVSAIPVVQGLGYGYFTGTGKSTSEDWVIRNCNGGDAITSAMTDKATFIATIKAYYASGTAGGCTPSSAGITRNRTGAAFVIQTMRGVVSNAGSANWPTSAEVTDWENRVNQPDVSLVWDSSYYFSINSAYIGWSSAAGGTTVGPTAADDVYYADTPGTTQALTFIQGGSVVYSLKHNCANPLGSLDGITKSDWNTSSSLGIVKLDGAGNVIGGPYYSDVNAAPGSRYGFRYSLKNDGPGSTTTTVYSQRTYTYPSSSQSWTGYGSYLSGKASGTYLTYDTPVGNTGIIPSSAGGKSYCLRMRSNPTGLYNSNYLYTPQRCVNIPYNYNLTPTSTIAPGYPDVVPAGGSTKYEYKVTNSGPTYSEPMTYRILQFVMPPGVVLNDGGLPYRDSQTANCPAWASGVCATTLYTSGSTTFIPTSPFTLPVPAGASDLTAAQTIGLAPGTRVCRLVALEKGSPTVVQRWSRPKCVTVGKKPFISIFNGDAWAGGNFMAIDNGSDGEPCSATGVQAGGFGGATTSYADGNDYGSFGEYQLFGIGSITSFGSGGRVLSAASPPSAATTMSYRATGLFYTPSVGPSTALTSHCLGDALPYYATVPPAASLGATVDLASFPSSGVYKRTGDLVINAMTIPAGRHVVVIATGKVTINGNIVLANPGGAPYYTNLSDIPSFTLINSGTANTSYITVRQAVTQLDGVYQTYHNFVTCTESEVGPIGLDSGVCQQQLVVNGAVTANRFVLRRVKGGDPDLINRSQPAEIFNLRSDVFLSAYGSSQTGGQIRTVSELELPPRY